jgi:pimeloyl-ACP methyl ester carboxylesterase
MLRHPKKVSGFFGLNTVGPWLKFDLTALRHLWRFLYQIPISLPVIGPRLLSDPKGRFFRVIGRWVGAGFFLNDVDFTLYVHRMSEPGHAVAGSRWYRTFLTRELIRAREFAKTSVDIPMRFLHGMDDPAITPTLLRGYAEHAAGFQLETVDDVGHWIVDQRPELVLDRLRAFLQET